MIDTPTVPACRERDIVDALAAQGYAVVANFLAEPTIVALRREAGRHAAAGELAAAGVGRGGARMERADIRGDRVRWLDDDASVPAERALRDALEALRSAINRELTLGLFEFEGHYAHYAPGAHYARHRDRFRDDDARVLSCVLYLNEGWCDYWTPQIYWRIDSEGQPYAELLKWWIGENKQGRHVWPGNYISAVNNTAYGFSAPGSGST